jgi:hypothetical protein
MARLVGEKIRTKLPVVTLFQRVRRQVAGACELQHVVPIPVIIPLKLRQGNIVSFQRVKAQMGPTAGVHRHEPLFVVFGRGSDGNSIKVKFVLPVQG